MAEIYLGSMKSAKLISAILVLLIFAAVYCV
jgi:hypothetical protein